MTPEDRKNTPVFSGVLMYFPDAIREVSKASLAGNKQHVPGQTLHWDRSKSTDEADSLVRHLMEAGTMDTDGVRHSAKVAWRALALLQKEIEAEKGEVKINEKKEALFDSIQEHVAKTSFLKQKKRGRPRKITN